MECAFRVTTPESNLPEERAAAVDASSVEVKKSKMAFCLGSSSPNSRLRNRDTLRSSFSPTETGHENRNGAGERTGNIGEETGQS